VAVLIIDSTTIFTQPETGKETRGLAPAGMHGEGVNLPLWMLNRRQGSRITLANTFERVLAKLVPPALAPIVGQPEHFQSSLPLVLIKTGRNTTTQVL
jgi:hypothetical protein